MGLMRREFLTRLTYALSTVPILAMSSPSLLGSLVFEPDGASVPPKPLPPNPFQNDDKSLVALIHGQDPATMLRDGLEFLGGIEKLGVSGQRVLIKPNVVNNRPPPTTTSPQVIAATVHLVREAGAADVTVADSSGVIRFPTSDNLVETGIRQAAKQQGPRF